MSHFAIIAPPLRGHYKPLSHLAMVLIERGHRVSFVHQEEARQLVEAPGSEFSAIGASAERIAGWTRPMSRIRGLVGLGGVMQRMQAFTTMFCSEGPALLRRLEVDAIIADQLEPAGGLVADHLGLPFVTIATGLPINREPGIPPPFVNWPFDSTDRGLRRNRGGWQITDLLLRGLNRTIARNAAALGLPPHRSMEDCFSTHLQLAQNCASLDFPRRAMPNSFHYVGPLRRSPGPVFRLPESDGRPTAFCSFGTLQGARAGLFLRVAQACDRLGYRLILTRGGDANRQLGNLPGDPLQFNWLPQEAILDQVDLVVSHAGLNSVVETLAAGIPMVVIPLAFEQPGTAARVARSGAGVMLSRSPSTDAIAKAIRTVHEERSFKRCAGKIASDLADCGGIERAADLIGTMDRRPR